MGFTHITVKLTSLGSASRRFRAEFLVDSGVTDSLVPANELKRIGLDPIGKQAYELANGKIEEYFYGLAEISFMDEVTAGRVIFGPDNIEPILGITALESVGIRIDPASRTLRRLAAIPLK